MIPPRVALFALMAATFVLGGCETITPEPPAVPISIDRLKVSSGHFNSPRFEAFADVRGHLTNGAAQLQEPRQWRRGYRLFIELTERTPVDAIGTTALVPVERSIPINIEGLAPGVYIVNVNGKEEHLEIRERDLLPPSQDRGHLL